MSRAKIEPGETSISLAGKDDRSSAKDSSARKGNKKEGDLHPELGLKSPTGQKSKAPKASPLDPGIDLGK